MPASSAPPLRMRRKSVPEAAGSAVLSELRALVRPFLRGLGLLAALVLVAASAYVLAGLGSAPATQTRTTVVQAGQSLWDVAAATGASDVAAVVVQISELNDLTGSTLQPGQTLVVPVV